ncbi:MAG: DNA repair protein RecN [Myxococcales bacterium]
MLTALRIENFAIIDALEVRFTSGFNVLTGETGAGKSILIDALNLALGGRSSAEVIRTGADEAAVEALFEGEVVDDRLARVGLPTASGELLIRRTVSRSGRGKVWINGALATVGILEELCRGLVDISGQHEHVSLLDPSLHLSLLDGYAGLQKDVEAYRAAWDGFIEVVRERSRLALDDAERARRADYLGFQLEEIDRLALEPGEDETLAAERRRLGSAEKLRGAAEEAERLLYSGEASAIDLLGQALGRIEDAAQLDDGLSGALTSLRSAMTEMQESARTLQSYVRAVEADPARLSEVEERLESIRRLCRKHGGDLQAVLKRRDDMHRELQHLTGHTERLAELDAARETHGRRALALARELSEKRRKAAKEFSKAVCRELAELAMARTSFEVSVKPAAPEEDDAGTLIEGAVLTRSGIDGCELLLSPNPGEELKPLARIASGGELSRVMLAIKRALARTDPVPTYVFDEVDTGIGGAVAEVVGQMLKEVSHERQVLCITHLPQIAACADQHFIVEKQVKGGRTTSRVVALAEGERTREVARMLAGVEVTRAALKNAEEMIEAAGRRERREASARAVRRSPRAAATGS